MKNRKWLGWTLVIVLVVAGVGFAGFQLGAAQSANLGWMTPFMHGRGFDGGMMRDGYDIHGGFDGSMMRGHGFDGYWGFPFFSPLFGLLRLAILGGLIWLGYRFIKNSGWRLVKAETPAPVTESPAADEENKDSA